MEKDEVMKMLFVEHHRHLSEIKLKIQSLTQRVVGLLALATGWILLAKNVPVHNLKVILVLTFLIICISALFALRRFNENYRVEARVISGINVYFKVHEEGYFIPKKELYPRSWKNFGNESVWVGIKHHVILIIVMTALAIMAVCFR